MFTASLLLSPDALASAYGEPVLSRLRSRVKSLTIVSPSETWREHLPALARTDVIFSGWGAPVMDRDFLDQLPHLKAVFYAGGSVRPFVSEAFWERGILLTTAQAANAIPVAEYASSALILGLKRFWHYARLAHDHRGFPAVRPLPGVYGSVVGLVSYGIIARLVRVRLRHFDVRVLVYDPYLTEAEAERENVTKVDLETLFASADAVSVHAPHLAETVGLIGAQHLAKLKSGAFFLNTARGEVVDEDALIAVLRERTDVTAVLDVTAPEPPKTDSPLYTLTNVVLTPHIAGSMGRECLRLGEAMLQEYERFCGGQPLQWSISADRATLIA